MADALPRERWTLAAGILFVVLGGLFPNLIVAQRSAEADTVARTLRMTDNAWARLRGATGSALEDSGSAPFDFPELSKRASHTHE